MIVYPMRIVEIWLQANIVEVLGQFGKKTGRGSRVGEKKKQGDTTNNESTGGKRLENSHREDVAKF